MKVRFKKDRIRRIGKWLLISAGGLVLVFFLLNLLFPVKANIQYSTIITDNKGEVIHAFLTADQQWRMKTELQEISPLLRKAIVAKEDRYFYSHPGVNLFALGRALMRNIFRMKRTSGASTITMQVARALEPKKRTYLNKLVEMFRAVQLELKFSKDEILQLYLNLVPYGGNIQGVKSASILYFHKNPDHLSLAEITALSIIPNRPNSLVPGKNNAKIIEGRNRWLKKFAADHLFSEKEIEDALAEPFTGVRGTVPKYLSQLSYALKRKGGDIIRTNIEFNTQLKLEKLVADYSRSLYQKNIRNAAVVVVDNTTHKIVSYVASANFRDTLDGGQVNGVTAVREPGSTLKPLLYGLCIDQGLLTPKTMITDVAVNYDGYAPENYDKKFNGYVTMEYALEHSLNIPAVKNLRALGKDQLIQKLGACNFQQVKKDQQKLGLSMILGGCGATLQELTGMYTVFANEGKFIRPAMLQSDSVVNPADAKRILSKAAVFMINQTLSKVNRPDFPLNWESTVHLPKIAWKTGTSYGRRDAWSIGYNKHYTVGIWVGNFSGTGVPELSGANVATPLLFKIFNTINYDADEAWFEKPASCDIRIVCAESGLPPGEHCPNRITDYFIPLTSSSVVCKHMQEVMISPDEKISYCKTCVPETGYKKKWYKIITPDMQAWYAENRVAYEKLPPHNPNCERIFKEGLPVIASPANGAEYLLNKKDPEPLQLSCRVGNDVSKVYWYINNKFFRSAEAGSKDFFLPPEGPVKISCTDDKGRNRDSWIRVRYINY